VWVVDPHGILGYVVDPARAVEALGEALDDLGSADQCPNPDDAVRAAFEARSTRSPTTWPACQMLR
jgi:hypothetical protein